MELLLVLDLNKSLILRVNGKVHVRKNIKAFVKFCFSIGDVAVYTSMLPKNIDLTYIFTNEMIKKLIFVWDRSKTFLDSQGTNSWDTLKSIDLIKTEYPNYERIIMVDDSPNKLRYIDPIDKIIIPPFEDIKEEGDVLIKLMEEIKDRLI